MTDAELTELYERHVDAVFRYCAFRLDSRADAEDATAEVFARLVAVGDRVASANRGRWLFTVARHVCTDQLRRAARLSGTAPLEAQLGTEEPRPWTCGPDVRAAIGQLTVGQQRVVFMRVVEDLSFAEIGRLIGRSETAVRMAYHRAANRLRSKLTEVRR